MQCFHFFVAKHFCYICLIGIAMAGLRYGRFIANRYKYKPLTYIQKLLVINGRGYLQKDLNGERVSSR
jgi:hypothetical protein